MQHSFLFCDTPADFDLVECLFVQPYIKLFVFLSATSLAYDLDRRKKHSPGMLAKLLWQIDDKTVKGFLNRQKNNKERNLC